MSDKCTSRFGRRRPFIFAGAVSIMIAVLIIGFSADIGWLLGDRGEMKVRAIAAFIVGFWLLDVANNMTQGPCRALLADLTRHRMRTYCYWSQIVVSLGSGPWDELFGGGNSPAFFVAALSAFAGGLIAILAIPRTRVQKPKILA
ncbi:hypothetical protein RND71_031358 [Anisodus tanguticus]|uniref:Uncharacterized protein n=1 Tax=Anisodus tanguticus TaxID=243964 RepID=A0AAE1RCC1_9SOLA|nr:hypothetical protein RND71_031358 [Anisodus tanguticus]